MSNIDLVVKIPEDIYKARQHWVTNQKRMVDQVDIAIANGTPLPKGHGRLIDADALNEKMKEREEELQDDRSMCESSAVEVALDMFAPTIIEADKE